MLWGLTTAGRCFGNRTFLVRSINATALAAPAHYLEHK